jgi:hypothetical protein
MYYACGLIREFAYMMRSASNFHALLLVPLSFDFDGYFYQPSHGSRWEVELELASRGPDGWWIWPI